MGLDAAISQAPFDKGIFKPFGKNVSVRTKTSVLDQATGKYTITDTPRTVRVVILPLNVQKGGDNLMDLPKGVNTQNVKVLYALEIVSVDSIVSYSGSDYRVIKHIDLDDLGRFSKCYIERQA